MMLLCPEIETNATAGIWGTRISLAAACTFSYKFYFYYCSPCFTVFFRSSCSPRHFALLFIFVSHLCQFYLKKIKERLYLRTRYYIMYSTHGRSRASTHVVNRHSKSVKPFETNRKSRGEHILMCAVAPEPNAVVVVSVSRYLRRK
jgi:hypothetical protein